MILQAARHQAGQRGLSGHGQAGLTDLHRGRFGRFLDLTHQLGSHGSHGGGAWLGLWFLLYDDCSGLRCLDLQGHHHTSEIPLHHHQRFTARIQVRHPPLRFAGHTVGHVLQVLGTHAHGQSTGQARCVQIGMVTVHRHGHPAPAHAGSARPASRKCPALGGQGSADTATPQSQPWAWITDKLLSEIAQRNFRYPFEFDTIDEIPVLCVRTAHVMAHISTTPTLREFWDGLPVKSDRVYKKQLHAAGVLMEGKDGQPLAVERTIGNARVSNMVAIPLSELAKFGLHAVVPKKYDPNAPPSGDEGGPRGPFDA